MSLSLSSSDHIPSHYELETAPFYQDCSQRILAVYFTQFGVCYVINAELLLELAREREGQNVGWDEWGIRTIEVRVGARGIFSEVWVSGCRLFCTIPEVVDDEGEEPFYLQIYDLSYAGRAKHLHAVDRANKNEGARRILTSLDGYKLPWGPIDFYKALSTTGHDSFVFWIVSIPAFLPLVHS